MPPRRLVALDAPTTPGEVAELLPRLAAALDGSGPALMLLPPGPPPLRTALLAAAEVEIGLERDDVALVAPTSGSSGAPRLALLTAAALTASATATADALGGAGSWVLALPSSYVAGLMVLVRSVLAGREPAVVDLDGGFTPERFADAVQQLRRHDGPHHTALVPAQLVRLLDAGDRATSTLAALDAVLLGGGGASADLLDRARATGATVFTTYGMAETCGGCVYDGLPLPGTRVDLADDGRIRLTGPTLFAGYRRRPDLTSQALDGGWFVTGDLGRVDADGRLHVLGRADDVVVTGGVKVVPATVEAALSDHPGVSDVVVQGRPSVTWGEAVVAVVEPVPGSHPTLDDLRDHARDRLPASWLPSDLVVVAALPRLPSGKPDRQAVRTLVAAPRP